MGQWGHQSSWKVDSQTLGPWPLTVFSIRCNIVFVPAPQPTTCLALGVPRPGQVLVVGDQAQPGNMLEQWF